MLCPVFGDHWFITNFILGLLDGIIVFPSLLFGVFWDVQVHDPCMKSWFYELGFPLGILATGFTLIKNWWWVFLIVLVVVLGIKIIIFLVVPVGWGIGIGIGKIGRAHV